MKSFFYYTSEHLVNKIRIFVSHIMSDYDFMFVLVQLDVTRGMRDLQPGTD